MINDGKGWFTDETDDRIPTELWTSSNGVVLVDIDADKDLDIAIANGWLPGDGQVFVNDGTGHFYDESSQRIPQDGGSSGSVAFGDIDNDGDSDLLVGNFSTSGVDNKLYVNDGQGYFTDETDNRFPSEEEETSSISLDDFDNDGDLDCYLANAGDHFLGEQNRFLINISTPDTFLPTIARTLIHSDTSDTTGPYVIASAVWDNISISIGELDVKVHYRTNESPFEEAPMYDCGGYLYRYGIPEVPPSTLVSYYIEARDRRGNVSLDPPSAPDSVYSFMVTGTSVEDSDPSTSSPRAFSLSQNYPNPFNPSTSISFEVPGTVGSAQRVSLVVYDIRGRRARALIESSLAPGTHQVYWDGRDDQGSHVTSGIYLYVLRAGGETLTRKMIALE
jgi:hypothetical protein